MHSSVVYRDVVRDNVNVAVNAAARVSRRITERLKERGLTGRALAQRLSHGDGWISGIKLGKWALGLDELDEAAEFLGLTPSDLVRKDGGLWELQPTEQRLVRALRALPPILRDHLVTLAEYLMGVAPDELEMLIAYRQLSPDERRRIQHGVDVLRATQSVSPRTEAHAHPPETAGRSSRKARREA